MLISSQINQNDYQEIQRLIGQFSDNSLELSQVWQLIYQKIEEKSLNWTKIRTLELISKFVYPLKEFNNNHVNKLKYRVKMLITNPVIFLKKLKAKLNKNLNKNNDKKSINQ
ncbi:hypothetical protein ACN4EE_08250 [Geminocystis sp. CENA526]|uniref:hypothetical protein n=1 Tax=Geminocystis sp. CENA526 TaxID=1355871 RepID=UPI003D6E4347